MKSKKFLVTGGAGFIGSHLSTELIRLGHQVAVIDDLSTGSLENIEHLLENESFHFARADIRNAMVLDRLASQSDVIIHLAAAVGVMLIVEQPVHTITTNIMGTENVLEVGKRYGCRVLLASTSEVYGKGSRIPFSEEDDVLLGPSSRNRWSYAASKMVDEFLGFAYHQEFGLKFTPFRLFNTVGPRQTGQYGMVIPRFVRQALRNESITVYGSGDQARCFCDVRDVIQAIIGLVDKDVSIGTLYNIGATTETTINELATKIKAMTGSTSDIQHISYDEAYAPGFEDMDRRVPCSARIQELLGWKPKLDLDDILQGVIDFEKEQL